MATADGSRSPSVPTSALLQDMLREKKAQTHRVKKTYDPLNARKDGTDGRQAHSSPVTSREKPGAAARHGSGMGSRQPSLPKEMGMKEMEQHLSKINKQNFDLKLEVFHCRQRNEILEAKVDNMEALEADNAEMQTINEDLLLELEKRDVAIQEAVNLICELEAKIEEMGEAEMYFRGSSSRTPQAIVADVAVGDAEGSSPDSQQRPDSNNTQDSARPDTSPAQPHALSPVANTTARRIPSFLKEKRKSTNVLRSLYSYDGSIGRPGSAFSMDDEEDEEDGNMISSPRLSILSESGFMSIYGDAKESDGSNLRQPKASKISEEAPARAVRSPLSQENQREARLQKWVEERDRPTTPTRAPSPKAGHNDRFSSIGEVLEDVPSATKEDGTHEHDTAEEKVRSARSPRKSDRKGARGHQRMPSSPTFGGPMFGGAILPPTPGTMSTATIAASSSTPSIVTEKSLLDGTPLPAKGYSTLIPDARPQSSDSDLAIMLGNTLAAEDDSDREAGSQRSNKSSRATRPSLATSNTDTIFSGEGYATIQPSRTLSYPSPHSRPRRASTQLHLTPKKSTDEPSSSCTQNERSRATVTPTRNIIRETTSRSPHTKQPNITPVPGSANQQGDTDTKPGRSGSLRAKTNQLSLTPSQPTHRSVASRLFRRSNSHSAQVPAGAQYNPPSRPPVIRETSSNHVRLPRPSSLYGSSPIYGQRPNASPSHPSSSRNKQREREHTCDSHRKYELPSIIPEGMLTNES